MGLPLLLHARLPGSGQPGGLGLHNAHTHDYGLNFSGM